MKHLVCVDSEHFDGRCGHVEECPATNDSSDRRMKVMLESALKSSPLANLLTVDG